MSVLTSGARDRDVEAGAVPGPGGDGEVRADLGGALEILVRNKPLQARIVQTPFVRRP